MIPLAEVAQAAACEAAKFGAILARDSICKAELGTRSAEFAKSKPRYFGWYESVIRADCDGQAFRAG